MDRATILRYYSKILNRKRKPKPPMVSSRVIGRSSRSGWYFQNDNYRLDYNIRRHFVIQI